MNKKILVFAGEKQSGKTSGCNFVTGLTLVNKKVIDNFSIDEKGDLVVPSLYKDEEGNNQTGQGVLDLARTDTEFVRYAINQIWPHCKTYNFADALKESINNIFGISLDLLYGTNEQKNTETHITWKNFGKFLAPRTVKLLKDADKYDSFMTVREVLQNFGTDVCRKIDDDCWVRACFNRILFSDSEISLIGDCRFVNEVKFSQKQGAKVIRVKPLVEFDDSHASEKDLSKLDDSEFDLVIDKKDRTIDEKNRMIQNAMLEWGWIESEVVVHEEVNV